MQLSDIKLLFQNGVLRDAYILPLFGDWTIEITRHAGESITLETQRGAVRHFKTLDAAFEGVKSVGFNRANIRQEMP